MKDTFLLKPEHIKLLENAYVHWEDCEYGAPAIDCKRPYGNSNVEHDMLEILNDIRHPNHGENWDSIIASVNHKELRKLHEETEIALQIILQSKSFIPGWYIREGYKDWKLDNGL